MSKSIKIPMEIIIPRDAYEQVIDLRKAIGVGNHRVFCRRTLYEFQGNTPSLEWDTYARVGKVNDSIGQKRFARIQRAFREGNLLALDIEVQTTILQEGEALPRMQMYPASSIGLVPLDKKEYY